MQLSIKKVEYCWREGVLSKGDTLKLWNGKFILRVGEIDNRLGRPYAYLNLNFENSFPGFPYVYAGDYTDFEINKDVYKLQIKVIDAKDQSIGYCIFDV